MESAGHSNRITITGSTSEVNECEPREDIQQYMIHHLAINARKNARKHLTGKTEPVMLRRSLKEE